MIERIASMVGGLLRALLVVLRLGASGSQVSSEEALRLTRTLGANASAGGGLAEASFERIRDAVLVAYGESAPARSERTVSARRAGRRLNWPWRSTFVLGSVGVLVLGLTSAAVAESGPGHVLYGARLALETLVLPNRDSQARLGAQLARLNLRVREATEAVEGRDEHALGAALAAYREALAEVAELAPRYLAARASVAPALAANLSVLEALERRLGARSPSQLDLTIDATRRAYFASLPALPVNSHELSPHHAGRSAATPTLSVAAQAGWFVRRSEGRWATDDALK